jgi:hypothetical protein
MSVEQARNNLRKVLAEYFPSLGTVTEGPLADDLNTAMDALQQAVMREYYTS